MHGLHRLPRRMTDERERAAIEQLVPITGDAGWSLTQPAIAVVVNHPAVTSAVIDPRTLAQLEDLLAGADTVLSDDVLDAVDDVVPPGNDLGATGVAHVPPAMTTPAQRRREIAGCRRLTVIRLPRSFA